MGEIRIGKTEEYNSKNTIDCGLYFELCSFTCTHHDYGLFEVKKCQTFLNALGRAENLIFCVVCTAQKDFSLKKC